MPYLFPGIAFDLSFVLHLCLTKFHGYMLGRYQGSMGLRLMGTLPVVMLSCGLFYQSCDVCNRASTSKASLAASYSVLDHIILLPDAPYFFTPSQKHAAVHIPQHFQSAMVYPQTCAYTGRRTSSIAIPW